MSRTFLVLLRLDLVRTISAARQSKTLPASALHLEKFFSQVHSKVVACLSALLKCVTLLHESENSLFL